MPPRGRRARRRWRLPDHHHLERSGRRMGDPSRRPADAAADAGRAAPARIRLPLRRQHRDVHADRQLQGRSGSRTGAHRTARDSNPCSTASRSRPLFRRSCCGSRSPRSLRYRRSCLARPRARRCGARRGTGADPAGARQPLLHPRGPRAAVLGRGRRDRQEPEPELRHAQPGDGEGAGSPGRYAEEDQGAGSPRRRGRTGRRRDRRHQAVRRAVLGAVGRPGRSRRRRVPDHRRPRARHSGQRRSPRFQALRARRPGARTSATGVAISAAASASSDSPRPSPTGWTTRASPPSARRRAPRRRGRQRAHDAERPDRQCRDRHQARRAEHRRDRGLAVGERS